MECGARLSSALESDLDDWSETRDSLLTVGLAPGKTHSSDADMKQLISIWNWPFSLESASVSREHLVPCAER